MVVLLKVSNVLIDHASQALLDEIREFRKEAMSSKASVALDDSIDSVLLQTAGWLETEFRKQYAAKQPTSSLPDNNQVLSRQAGLLRSFTQMWSIFQLAWRQNRDTSGNQASQAIIAGNIVARGLYEITDAQNLDLVIPNQVLVVVPAGAEGYSIGFDSPTPYIVAPYWGLSQVWTWLSYAHEIGHHVYRNVNGLSDELKVNVTLELWKQNLERKYQIIWFNWLEEIFADLFGLLRIGSPFAHTQQLLMPYLPEPAGWPEVSGPTRRLLIADDLSHPMPYLRIFLTICALEKLGTNAEIVKPLWDNLKAALGMEAPQNVYVLLHGGSQELAFEDMKQMGDYVLNVLLDTKLNSLAKLTEPSLPRSLREIFFDPDRRGSYEMLLANVYSKLEELAQMSSGSINDVSIDVLNKLVIKSILQRSSQVSQE